jgi:hypothetical protein
MADREIENAPNASRPMKIGQTVLLAVQREATQKRYAASQRAFSAVAFGYRVSLGSFAVHRRRHCFRFALNSGRKRDEGVR